MKKLGIAIVVLIVLFTVAGIASYILLPAPSPTPYPTPLYKVTALATTSADERYPVWSPDGSKIFFKSDNWICVCNPDGSHRENLTEIKETYVFSPDMKRVFYKKTMSNEDKTTWQACVMDIDGKNREKIAEFTFEGRNLVSDRHTSGPTYVIYSWNPDRTKIFFLKQEATGYT